LAAGGGASALFAVYDAVIAAQVYLADNVRNDFSFYYGAARIGMRDGWSHIYDLDLMQKQLDAIATGSQATLVSPLARFVSPPPLAWLVTPFALLPFQAAYALWVLMLVAALVLAWRLAAPGAGWARVIHLVAAVAWIPVAYGLQVGQPVTLVAAAVAAGYALLKAGREWQAGAVLGLMVVKPQLAFLVPLALLVSGHRRAFVSFAALAALLAIASAINIGPNGLAALWDRLTFAGTKLALPLTLQALVPWASVTHLMQFAIAVWALTLAYFFRRRIELVVSAALVGGLLATPYLHFDDFAMLGLAMWLYLRTPGPSWRWAFLLALVVAVEGIPIWGAIPALLGELSALVLLSFSVSPQSTREPLRAGH
jgi:hypothetical protein